MKTATLQLLHDAYHATGGFEDGSYLVQYPLESAAKFSRRKEGCYYLNYLRPVVDGHCSPIFRRKIERAHDGGDSWEAFLSDASRGGVSLEGMMHDAAWQAKLYGCHVLAMTAPAEAPATAAQEVDARPWLFHVPARAITELVRDRFGRVERLAWTESDGKVRTYTSTGWSLTSGDVVVESSDWGTSRGDAPVVLLEPGDWIDGRMLPVSEFAAIARVSARLFNLGSELDEILRSSTFPILTYPSKTLKDLKLGTENALGYDPDKSHKPEFIAPPNGPAETIQKQIDRLVREIYRMAVLSHQVGNSDSLQAESAKSGIALRIDREDFDSALAFWAAQLETAEKQVHSLFQWWTGRDFGYSVAYPMDFTLEDTATKLQLLTDAVAGLPAMPPAMAQQIYVLVARLILAEGDELDQVVEEIRQRGIDDTQTGSVGSGAA